MSITFNSHTSASGSGATLTFSHTVDAGDDRVLLVGVSTVTGSLGTVTFDGVPLNEEISQDPGGGGTRPWSVAFSLIAPPVGTFDIAAPHEGSSSGFRRRVVGAITAYGADQETPFRGWVGQGIESGTSLSVSPTSAVGDQIIDVVGAETGTATPGTGQSQLWNDTESIVRGTASTKDGEAGSTEMSWTVESSQNSMVASAIVPAEDEPGDVSASDSGTATDSAAITDTVVSVDAGEATDTATIDDLADDIQATDQGRSHHLAIIAEATSQVDSGEAADEASVAELVTGQDAGEATDAAAIQDTVAATDSATGTDTAATEEPGVVTAGDSGTATDAAAITDTVAAAEEGEAADAAAVGEAIVAQDAGTSVDAATLLDFLVVSDLAAGVDTASTDAVIPAAHSTWTAPRRLTKWTA